MKTFTQGDIQVAIADTLVDANNTVVDLTGKTVQFRMVARDSTVKVNSATATVDSPATSGLVSYQWVAGDIDTQGTYYYQWITIDGSGRKQHFPPKMGDAVLKIQPVV